LIVDPNRVDAVKSRIEAALSYTGTPAHICQSLSRALHEDGDLDKPQQALTLRRLSFGEMPSTDSKDGRALHTCRSPRAGDIAEVFTRTKDFLKGCGHLFHRRGFKAPRVFISYIPNADLTKLDGELAAVNRIVQLLQSAGASVEHCSTNPRPDGNALAGSIAECDFVILMCTQYLVAATEAMRKDAPYKAEFQKVLSRSWGSPESILPVLIDGEERTSIPQQICTLSGRMPITDCRENAGKDLQSSYWNAICSEHGLVPTIYCLRDHRETWKSYEAMYFDLTKLPAPKRYAPRREGKRQAIAARLQALQEGAMQDASTGSTNTIGIVPLVGDTSECSALAVAYARDAIDHDLYDFARYLDVGKANAHASWLEFASSIGVDINKLSINDVIVKTLRRVSHYRYLLVFANAESLLSIKKMLPQSTSANIAQHVIVTSSTTKNWVDPISIGPWSEAEGVAYVHQFCSANDVPVPSADVVGQLIGSLNWSPTAIAMALGHMSLHNAPMDAIVNSLEACSGSTPKATESPVAVCWRLIKPQLQSEYDQSYRLITLLSCLNYRISESILHELCTKVFDVDFDELMAPLLLLSLIRKSSDKYYTISRAIQNSICSAEFGIELSNDYSKKKISQMSLSDVQRFQVADHVLPPLVNALYTIFPTDDEKTDDSLIFTCVVSTHVTRLLKIIDMLCLEEGDGVVYQNVIEMMATLLHMGGQSEMAQGNYRDCQDMLTRARDMLEEIFPDGHVLSVKNMSTMADMYYQQGQLDEALDILKEWKAASVKLLGPDHAEVARGLHVTGLVYRALGRYAKALECYSEGLTIRRSLFGDNHEFVASSLGSMANVHLKIGDLKASLACFEEALAIRMGLYGSKHVLVVGTRNNVAMVHNNMGEHNKALDCYKTNLAVFRSIYAHNDHPQLADTLNNLGVVYYGIGHYGLAIENMSEALKIRRVLYGSEHISVAECLNNLGNTYCSQGRNLEAVECCLQALSIKKKLLSGSHPSLAGNLKNLAIIYNSLKDFDRALSFASDAYEMCVQSEGSESDAVADVLTVMGDIHKKKKNLDDALDKYNRALAIKRQHYEVGNASIAELLNDIGAVYTVWGRNADARAMFEEAMVIVRKLYQPNFHHSIADILVNIGNVHLNEHNLELAMQSYEEALDIYNRTRGSHHPIIASVLCCIAAVHCFRHQNEIALEKYVLALEIQRAHNSTNEVAVVLHNIGILNYQSMEYDMALKNFEEALELRKNESGSEIWQAETLNNMGMACNKMHEYALANEYFVQAVGLYKRHHGSDFLIADTLCNIASAYYLDHKYDLALSRFEEAVSIYRRIEADTTTIADVYANIGHTHFHKKDFVSAMESYEVCFSLQVPDLNHIDFSAADNIARMLQLLCSSLCHMGCVDEAIGRYKDMIAVCEKSGGADAKALQVKLQGLLAGVKKKKQDEGNPAFKKLTNIWQNKGPAKKYF
jgi:tetratricopeptide (TPR) repeat protein